ncbi:hypothetical protein BD408DRAFT_464239 [Parasitella parasitica]|nr:hypothetical protein BD408DRAFT_464239 [Parasitella parasitica]
MFLAAIPLSKKFMQSCFRGFFVVLVIIAGQTLIQESFKEKRRKKVVISKKSRLKISDTDLLMSHNKKNWRKKEELSLKESQNKTIITLYLTTIARPTSNVSCLKHQDNGFIMEEGKFEAVRLFFREPKEAQVKMSILGKMHDESICPVRTMQLFMRKTRSIKAGLPNGHTLFLSYINNTEKTRSTRPAAISGWIKRIIEKAGVDTEVFKAHSIRSVARTKAVEKGFDIFNVKIHAIGV